MSYTVHYGVLRTGQITSTLPVASCTAGDEMRGTGSFSATVAAGQCGNGALWQATRGAATFWALEWTGNGSRRIVAAGPMWSRTGDDDKAQYVGANLFTILAHRKLIDPAWTDATIPLNALIYTGLDIGSIIAAIVAKVTTVTTAALPIIFEAARAGTALDPTGLPYTFQGYDLANTDTVVTDLGNVASATTSGRGPDWTFTPQFRADGTSAVDYTHIEWVLTTGSSAAPTLTQSGPPIVLDRGAPNQQYVGAVSVLEDAQALATTYFIAAGGSQHARIISSATDPSLTDLGYPRLDADDSSNSINPAVIASYAVSGLARRGRTPSTTNVAVQASWWWSQGANVGATVQLLDPMHPVFGKIDLTSRVMKWAADVTSDLVQLTLADSLTQV